jgi:hypothetical protein
MHKPIGISDPVYKLLAKGDKDADSLVEWRWIFVVVEPRD